MDGVKGAFETWLRAQDKAESTIRGYTTALEQFARWFQQTNCKPLKPAAITPLDVKTRRSHLRTVCKLPVSTINLKLAAIRGYTSWAKAAGKIRVNPANGIKMLKRRPTPPRWLTWSEQFALLRAA